MSRTVFQYQIIRCSHLKTARI